jgi:hypothetical protein
MAEQQDSIFREIDEEMRREQILKIWKEYGTYIIGAVAAIVLGVGGYQAYLHQKKVAIEASGTSYDAAAQLIANGKADEATAALEKIAKSGPAGYATLSQLRLAAAAAKAGKTDAAVSAYDALAKDNATDRLLADFARLQAASLRLDVADWTEMQNRLIDLSDNANPWRYSAREMMGLAALKNGQIEQARKFNEVLLGERKVPPSILERVKVMMATIIATELAAPTPVPAATPAPKAEATKTPEPPKPAEELKKKK